MLIVVDGAINVENEVLDEGSIISDPVPEDLPTSTQEQVKVWGKVVVIDPATEEGRMYLRMGTSPMQATVMTALQNAGFDINDLLGITTDEEPQEGDDVDDGSDSSDDDDTNTDGDDVEDDDTGGDSEMPPKKSKKKKSTRKKKG